MSDKLEDILYAILNLLLLVLLQTGAGSQVLLDNTERFAELLAMSQNNLDSGEPIRISRPNIGE